MLSAAGWLLLLAQIAVTEQTKLRPSSLGQQDRFGCSVDVHRDRVVVGAFDYRDDALAAKTGAAFVFELVAGEWKEQARLMPSSVASAPVKDWDFGYAVACDSERILVGARTAKLSTATYPMGLAFVYRLSGGTWIEEAMLDPQDGSTYDFGYRVDIDGDVALVSGQVMQQGIFHPVVYVFARVGSSWVKEARLEAPDPHDDLGSSIALRGDTAFIGAHLQYGDGAAYVFQRSGTSWSVAQEIIPPGLEIGDLFGFSLAVDPTTFVVGAPFDDEGKHDRVGSARVFEQQGGLWLEKQLLVPKGYSTYATAAYSVAVDGDLLVLGEPSIDADPGSFHVYSRGPAGWGEQLEITADQAKPGSALGWSLALDGQRLVVGALNSSHPWQNTGAAYVFEIQSQNPAPAYYCSAKQDSLGCVPRIYHFGQPSMSGALQGEHYVVNTWDVQPGVASSLLYSTTGAASLPFHGGLLCILAPTYVKPTQLTKDVGRFAPCDGTTSVDFNEWIAGGNDPALVAGQDVWMQVWYRDPTGAPGSDIGLSAGLHAVISP